MTETRGGQILTGTAWFLAFSASIIAPSFLVPLEPVLPFRACGAVAGMSGFGITNVAFSGIKGIKNKTIIALILLLSFIGSAGGYRYLLFEYASPSILLEWFELFLFSIGHFCAFAILAILWQTAAPYVGRVFGVQLPTTD